MAAEKPGGISLLAHAAGAMGQWASVAAMAPSDWQRYIAVDLHGCFHALHVASPHLRRQGGAILAISSIPSQMYQARNAQGTAAKAGVEALIRVTAKEEARHKIRANALAIGLTQTEMAQTAFDAWGPEPSARIIKGHSARTHCHRGRGGGRGPLHDGTSLRLPHRQGAATRWRPDYRRLNFVTGTPARPTRRKDKNEHHPPPCWRPLPSPASPAPRASR